MIENITENGKEIFSLFKKIRNRDFKGNSGLAIKNSVYQIAYSFVSKIGSLLFTIILARILMPELFGLYNLVLSIIVIFATFAELGIGMTIIKFISAEFEKKQGRLKSSLIYFSKLKAILIFISAVLLIIFADYIANTFYQKPIFLALLAGALYIVFIQLTALFQPLIYASNNPVPILKREIFFQIIRIILVPLAVFFAIKCSLSDETTLMIIILALAITLFFASLVLFYDIKKIYFSKFRKEKDLPLPKKQKIKINKFILATSMVAISSVFFGNIDKIMLGKFVAAQFVGYYSAAFNLISAFIQISTFASAVVLPIFSRLKNKKLEAGFRKTISINSFIAAIAFLITLIFSYFIILITYGSDYSPATNILRILSFLLFVFPVAGIYQSYYIAQNRPNYVAKLLIVSTILNIILNYFLITYLLKFGDLAAVYGATSATIISNFFYLAGLVMGKKKR